MILARKEIGGTVRVEIEELVFIVRPQHFGDLMEASAVARKIDDDEVAGQILVAEIIFRRIIAWEGIDYPDGGGPVPCTLEFKRIVFGRHPDLVFKILEKVTVTEDDVEKNSPTSPPGPSSGKAPPAGVAPSSPASDEEENRIAPGAKSVSPGPN